MISVIMPTHNRAYLIEPSIASVIKPDVELVVVDDRSTDDTEP